MKPFTLNEIAIVSELCRAVRITYVASKNVSDACIVWEGCTITQIRRLCAKDVAANRETNDINDAVDAIRSRLTLELIQKGEQWKDAFSLA